MGHCSQLSMQSGKLDLIQQNHANFALRAFSNWSNIMKSPQSYILNTGRRVVKQLRQRNYTFAKAYYQYKLYRSSLRYKGSPLLIYQMGKVGSVTILRSLEALELDMPIYHTHFLSQHLVDEEEKRRRKYFGTHQAKGPGWQDPRRPWLNQYLRNQIKKGSKDKKWKIVTLVRDPISRNTSAFFQSLELKRLDYDHQYQAKSFFGFETIVDLEDLGPFITIFFEKSDHDTPLVFFDRELKDTFGIDVYSSAFPKSKGYKIYEEERADVLLIRLENLDECAQDAFKEFLGIDGFTLTNKNVAGDKPYRALYQRFLDSIVLPDSYLDRMYTSKYARHFYSEEEINKFKAKWRKENAAQEGFK